MFEPRSNKHIMMISKVKILNQLVLTHFLQYEDVKHPLLLQLIIFLLTCFTQISQSKILQVHLPGTKIESYTEAEPVSHNGKEINFGPYTDVEPFTSEELRLHFENNTPFAVATKMTREIEVSHWGNVYIEEHYVIRHTGAKLRVCTQLLKSSNFRFPRKICTFSLLNLVSILTPRSRPLLVFDEYRTIFDHIWQTRFVSR